MQPKKSSLTQERLKKLFYYNADIGIFIRKKNRSTAHKGSIAGCLTPSGYLCTRIDNRLYSNHRLAWLYVYGYLPENCIDHINRDRTDNRIENLREVSAVCNARNAGNYKNNTSGVKGISWIEERKKWSASIKVPGKRIHLGHYDTLVEAAIARASAEDSFDWVSCDKLSPAKQYLNL